MDGANNKKSFVLYKDLKPVIDKLSNSDAGKLLKAIYHYQTTGEESVDADLDLVFTMIVSSFKRDNEKYSQMCVKRREAGSRGGKQKVANASNSKQDIANVADSDSGSDSVNDITTKAEDKPPAEKKKSSAFKAPSHAEVTAYSNERRALGKPHITAEEFIDGNQQKGWMIGKNKMKDWRAAFRTWERYRNKPSSPNNGISDREMRELNEQMGK